MATDRSVRACVWVGSKNYEKNKKLPNKLRKQALRQCATRDSQLLKLSSFSLELPSIAALPSYCAQVCSSTSDLGTESGIPTLTMSPGTASAAFVKNV